MEWGEKVMQEKRMSYEQTDVILTPEQIERFMTKGYENRDILPKPSETRNMETINFFTLWMGNLHNIPNYASVGGFIVLGIAPFNIMLALIMGAVLVGLLMGLNGIIGSKYGIPFSMHLRSAYGETGAKLPGFLRGIVTAIGWFGLQTYAGSQAMLILVAQIWPGVMTIGGDTQILGISIPGLIMFLIFWAVNVAIGLTGGEFLNKFNNILTILIYVLFIGMAIWGVRVAGGFGNILNYQSSSEVTPPNVMFSYLLVMNAVLAFWSAPTASVSDFTQNASSTKSQKVGQGVGVIFGYVIFAFTSMSILIGASIHYGTEHWDILTIINNWDSLPAIVFASLTLLLITVNSNAVANVIPASFQLNALFPRQLNYKKGVWIASIIGLVIMPWKLMENPDSIYTFLNAIGAVLGPVLGVLVYQFFVVDKQEIELDELYFNLNTDEGSRYKGINVNAYIATLVAVILSLVGNFIPSLSILSQLSWIVGFLTAVILYSLLTKVNQK